MTGADTSPIDAWRARVTAHHSQSERAITAAGGPAPTDVPPGLARMWATPDPRRTDDPIVARLLRELPP
jgi:hypothetical protein